MTPKIVSKAFDCWFTWADNAKGGPYTTVREQTAGKARSLYYRQSEIDDTILNVRCRRNPGMDLVAHPSPHIALDLLTAEQLRKMAHAIGHDYHSEEPYRNYFNTENDPDFERMIRLGLATKRGEGRQTYYHLTDLGLDVIRSSQPITRYRFNAHFTQTASA